MEKRNNLDFLFKDFAKQSVVVSSLPAVVYLSSVDGCPNSCVMCRARGTKATKMSNVLLKKIEPFFSGLEVLSVHGSGEPLLGDIDYFVEQAKKNNFVLHFNTTGFLLNKVLVRKLLKARLSIRFSIHAGTKETYRKIMGKDFDKVMENIGFLVSESNRLGLDNDFWFSFIVMKENIGEINDFLFLASKLGIKKVRFMRLNPNRETVRGIKMKDRDYDFNYFEQFNSVVRKKFLANLPACKKLAKSLGIVIEPGSMEFSSRNLNDFFDLLNFVSNKFFKKKFFPLHRKRMSCVAPWFGQLMVEQNGDVFVCCSRNVLLGNLNDSSLLELWNCETMQRVRKAFKEKGFLRSCGYCQGISLEDYPANSFKKTTKAI